MAMFSSVMRWVIRSTAVETNGDGLLDPARQGRIDRVGEFEENASQRAAVVGEVVTGHDGQRPRVALALAKQARDHTAGRAADRLLFHPRHRCVQRRRRSAATVGWPMSSPPSSRRQYPASVSVSTRIAGSARHVVKAPVSAPSTAREIAGKTWTWSPYAARTSREKRPSCSANGRGGGAATGERGDPHKSSAPTAPVHQAWWARWKAPSPRWAMRTGAGSLPSHVTPDNLAIPLPSVSDVRARRGARECGQRNDLSRPARTPAVCRIC